MPFVDSSNFRTLQLDQERQLASRYSPENEDLFGNSLPQVGATDENEPPTSVWTTERHRLLTESVIHESAQIYFANADLDGDRRFDELIIGFAAEMICRASLR